MILHILRCYFGYLFVNYLLSIFNLYLYVSLLKLIWIVITFTVILHSVFCKFFGRKDFHTAPYINYTCITVIQTIRVWVTKCMYNENVWLIHTLHTKWCLKSSICDPSFSLFKSLTRFSWNDNPVQTFETRRQTYNSIANLYEEAR